MDGSREWLGRAPRVMALGVAVLLGLAGQSVAETRAVTGQAGILGEWELTATVTEQGAGAGREWSGPLSLKHTGFCSADGAEEKSGELRLRIASPPDEATATLLIDGTACTFKGHLQDGYSGTMTCPDRRGVPMMLSIQ